MRLFVALLTFFPLLFLSACSSDQEGQADWKQYKSTFLSTNGSVVDAVNGNMRHSEGQGMGMLFAADNKDKKVFDKIWLWTKKHLQIRQNDHLLAWSWSPEEPHVKDFNNATDGDILVAWALLRGFEQWGDEVYKAEALKLMKDIQKHLIIKQYGHLLLLPGQYGFTKDDGVIINPSYWVFPAFEAFMKFNPEETIWSELIQSGLTLLDEASFGAWRLTPDWLFVGETLAPAKRFPKHFGLDAVRVPLYMLWSGYSDHSTVIQANKFWSQFSGLRAWPEWGGLETTNVHMGDMMQGVHNIAVFTGCRVAQKNCANDVKVDWEHGEYYQVTLQLLTRLAEKDLLK